MDCTHLLTEYNLDVLCFHSALQCPKLKLVYFFKNNSNKENALRLRKTDIQSLLQLLSFSKHSVYVILFQGFLHFIYALKVKKKKEHSQLCIYYQQVFCHLVYDIMIHHFYTVERYTIVQN